MDWNLKRAEWIGIGMWYNIIENNRILKNWTELNIIEYNWIELNRI